MPGWSSGGCGASRVVAGGVACGASRPGSRELLGSSRWALPGRPAAPWRSWGDRRIGAVNAPRRRGGRGRRLVNAPRSRGGRASPSGKRAEIARRRARGAGKRAKIARGDVGPAGSWAAARKATRITPRGDAFRRASAASSPSSHAHSPQTTPSAGTQRGPQRRDHPRIARRVPRARTSRPNSRRRPGSRRMTKRSKGVASDHGQPPTSASDQHATAHSAAPPVTTQVAAHPPILEPPAREAAPDPEDSAGRLGDLAAPRAADLGGVAFGARGTAEPTSLQSIVRWIEGHGGLIGAIAGIGAIFVAWNDMSTSIARFDTQLAEQTRRLEILEGEVRHLAGLGVSGQEGDAGVQDAGVEQCTQGYADCDADPRTPCDSLQTTWRCGACEVHCADISGAGDYDEDCVEVGEGEYECALHIPPHTRANGDCSPGWVDCNGGRRDGCEVHGSACEP